MAEDDDAWDFDDIARNTREANSYGYSKDRAVMEAGITTDVLTALRLPFEQLRSRPQREQPPDCESIVSGRRTGIELTEFMHQPTLEKNIKTNERLPLSPGIPLWKQPNLRAPVSDGFPGMAVGCLRFIFGIEHQCYPSVFAGPEVETEAIRNHLDLINLNVHVAPPLKTHQ